MICNKVFLVYETGTPGADLLNRIFREVFRGWDIKTGDELLSGGIRDKATYGRFKEIVRNRCVFGDLSGVKRDSDNGLNLNVLFEMGMTLGMSRPCYIVFDSRRVKRQNITERASDLVGLPIHSYHNPEVLRLRLDEAKQFFKEEMSHRFLGMKIAKLW